MESLLQPTKLCTGPCGRELSATNEYFYKNSQGKYGLDTRCKDCRYAHTKAWRLANPEKRVEQSKRYYQKHPETSQRSTRKYTEANPEKVKARLVKNWLRSLYGLTEHQYQELWDSQNGKCAVCNELETKGKRLHVDHDHSCCPGEETCGKCIRGLLCGKCNTGLGMFNDKEITLLNAVQYLRKNTKPKIIA